MITKQNQTVSSGTEFKEVSNLSIGYIIAGTKLIRRDDNSLQLNKGEVYYINAGRYYIENIADKGSQFEEIVVVYSPQQLGSILNCLSQTFQFTIEHEHSCDDCRSSDLICKSGINLSNFFNSLNQCIRDDMYKTDLIGEALKKSELIYLALAYESCCIKSIILNNNILDDKFQQIIHNNLFKKVALPQLAKECGISLSAFKNKFEIHFASPPRKWITTQRLRHSRVLLISTNKTIATISDECLFVNTSHFIKLFKARYGQTPAYYRSKRV